MSTPFRDALALTGTRDGFTATLTDTWTIGPKAHGGMLMALCAHAATQALGGDGATPVAVSATFLRPPDPGPVELAVETTRRGRRVTTA